MELRFVTFTLFVSPKLKQLIAARMLTLPLYKNSISLWTCNSAVLRGNTTPVFSNHNKIILYSGPYCVIVPDDGWFILI